MSAVSSDKIVSSSLLAFSLFLAVLASCFFFFLSLHKIASIKETYKVDELVFIRAVDMAVSNYFDNVLAYRFPAKSDTTIPTDMDISFVPVDGLGTYYTNLRGWRCVIGDISYGIGDYCEHGLIRRIADGRVYCTSQDKTLVLRRATAGRPSPKKGADAPPSPDGGAAL